MTHSFTVVRTNSNGKERKRIYPRIERLSSLTKKLFPGITISFQSYCVLTSILPIPNFFNNLLFLYEFNITVYSKHMNDF